MDEEPMNGDMTACRRSPDCFQVAASSCSNGDMRLDASHYLGREEGARFVAESSLEFEPLGNLCGTIWHPVQNQARSNFKRIYTDAANGIPFLGSRAMFYLPVRSEKNLAHTMPKLRDLRVPEGWLLVSRSGTTGVPLLVGRNVAACAVTDHAIRIEPTGAPAGYLYAVLASRHGQAYLDRGVYGKTVDELEPKHVAEVPVPSAPASLVSSIDGDIRQAFELRDKATDLLRDAESLMHQSLGLARFDENTVVFANGLRRPKVFFVEASSLGCRLDASNHVPITQVALEQLQLGRYKMSSIGAMCEKVVIPGRFKREYVSEGEGIRYLVPSQMPTFKSYGLKSVSHRQATQMREYLLVEGELLVSTDGTIGRAHPVTSGMVGWFGSNNLARLADPRTDMGYVYAFLDSPYGALQLKKPIFGGVVDHIDESHIRDVRIPDAPSEAQKAIGDVVRNAYGCKDLANQLEERAIAAIESFIALGEWENVS